MATSDRKHPDESALLAFCARRDNTADYVRRTADWIKEQFPGSASALIPRLRKIYRDKLQG